MKALGVSFSNKFSFSGHVDNLLAACSQTLFALRTLRAHGLPVHAIYAVYQATVIGKLTYASQAWWGFANAADLERVEAFLRRSVKMGYRPEQSPTFASICSAADNKLFRNIINNTNHLLHPLLPPLRSQHHSLRTRAQLHQLPKKDYLA